MHFDQHGKFVRTDAWREGKWIDLWSVVHFLSGATMGFFPRYLGLNAFAAYSIAFLLMVSYEMFEALVKIEETPENRVMDVVTGMASFVPVYYLNPLLSISTSIILCGISLTSSSMLSVIGWRASQKATAFEKKLRGEIERGRKKIETRLHVAEARFGEAKARFHEKKIRRRLRKMERRELRAKRRLERTKKKRLQ